MFQFEHIELLWTLAGIPLLVLFFLYVLWWKRKTARKIGDAALVKELTKTYSPTKFTGKFCRTVGFR